MALYRFYRLNAGQVVSRKVLECATDAEAVDQALRLAQTGTVEVWTRERLVAKLSGSERVSTGYYIRQLGLVS